jgi:hypothetical protein
MIWEHQATHDQSTEWHQPQARPGSLGTFFMEMALEWTYTAHKGPTTWGWRGSPLFAKG